jgi:hypothetical protein
VPPLAAATLAALLVLHPSLARFIRMLLELFSIICTLRRAV